MELQKLKSDIENNQINNLYIFDGEEHFLKMHYINKLKNALNLPVVFIENATDIKPNNLFNTKSLYVLNTSNIKELKIYNNFLVIICESIDKRTSFYKENKENIIEFNKLNENQLIQYIKKQNINLSHENYLDLLKKCNYDLGLIDLELHKFTNYNINFTDDDYNYIKNTTYDIINDDITFELVNSILNKKDILVNYNKCVEINQSVIGMLSALYINLKQLLQIQTSGKDIQQSSGLSTFVINKLLPYKNTFSNSQLLNMLELIFDIDIKIKIGKLDQTIAFKYFLSKAL